MNVLVKTAAIIMVNKIILLCEYGILAKKTKDPQKIHEIYSIMSQLCHELRPIEAEFKVVYPQLEELYNLLLSYKGI